MGLTVFPWDCCSELPWWSPWSSCGGLVTAWDCVLSPWCLPPRSRAPSCWMRSCWGRRHGTWWSSGNLYPVLNWVILVVSRTCLQICLYLFIWRSKTLTPPSPVTEIKSGAETFKVRDTHRERRLCWSTGPRRCPSLGSRSHNSESALDQAVELGQCLNPTLIGNISNPINLPYLSLRSLIQRRRSVSSVIRPARSLCQK